MATGALVNAVWDLRAKLAGKPMWRFLAELPTDELVASVDFHHITDALTPDEAAAILDKGRDGLADRLAGLERDGFPSYTTSVGWLGYPDDKVRALTREAYAAGVAGDEDEGRRADRGRPAAGPDHPGRDRPGRAADDGRQPGLGRRRGDRRMARAGRGRPVLDRGAHARRRRPRPRPDRPRGHRADRRPLPGRHRRGRRQPGHLQAAAPGRGDRRDADRRLPGRRRQRGARRAADGGEVRRAGLPARRRRGPLRVRPAPGDLRLPAGRHQPGRPDGRVRRPPARALRRPGPHPGRPLPAARARPATAPP